MGKLSDFKHNGFVYDFMMNALSYSLKKNSFSFNVVCLCGSPGWGKRTFIALFKEALGGLGISLVTGEFDKNVAKNASSGLFYTNLSVDDVRKEYPFVFCLSMKPFSFDFVFEHFFSVGELPDEESKLFLNRLYFLLNFNFSAFKLQMCDLNNFSFIDWNRIVGDVFVFEKVIKDLQTPGIECMSAAFEKAVAFSEKNSVNFFVSQFTRLLCLWIQHFMIQGEYPEFLFKVLKKLNDYNFHFKNKVLDYFDLGVLFNSYFVDIIPKIEASEKAKNLIADAFEEYDIFKVLG